MNIHKLGTNRYRFTNMIGVTHGPGRGALKILDGHSLIDIAGRYVRTKGVMEEARWEGVSVQPRVPRCLFVMESTDAP